MTTDTCTVSFTLNPRQAKALELALRDNREALGAISLDLEETYHPEPIEEIEDYRDETEALLEAYYDELREVSNGEKIAEEAGIQL